MFKKQTIIPAVLWGFFILYLTLKPKSSEDSPFLEWLKELHPDKIAHFVFWGLWYVVYHFTYLKYHSTADSIAIRRHKEHVFIVLAIVIGGIVEMLQLKLNWGRSAEWLDLIADGSGVLSVFLFFKLKDNSV